MTKPQFTYPEQHLAEVTGVSRSILRSARNHWLTEHADWSKHGRQILLTESAVRELTRVLPAVPNVRGTGHDRFFQDLLKKLKNRATYDSQASILDAKSATHTMRIRKMYVNPKIMGARLLDKDGNMIEDGPLLRLRVRNNKNLKPGMEIPVRHVQADLWEHVGKGPRRRGKW